MRITILGSGTCVPSLRRSSPGLLLQSDAANILCDTGPGTLRQLLHTGKTINNIDGIVYSHFHVDHTADLVSFIFASKYAHGISRDRDLTIMGPPGLCDFYESLTKAYGPWIVPEQFSINWIEMGCETASYFDLSVTSAPVQHAEQSMAVRFRDAGGRAAVYSGDTDYCPEIVQLAKNADVCVLECAFPDTMRCPGHLTPSLAGRVAREAGCKKLVLTHFYPPCDDVDIEAGVRNHFPGEVILAEDLMSIDI